MRGIVEIGLYFPPVRWKPSLHSPSANPRTELGHVPQRWVAAIPLVENRVPTLRLGERVL
jgi:hypothetical protein